MIPHVAICILGHAIICLKSVAWGEGAVKTKPVSFSRGPLWWDAPIPNLFLGGEGEAGVDANVPVLFQGHLSLLGLLGKEGHLCH